MNNPKASVDVWLYDKPVLPGSWLLNDTMTLCLIAGDHSHPHAIQISGPGLAEPLICHAHELIEAVEWLRKVLP